MAGKLNRINVLIHDLVGEHKKTLESVLETLGNQVNVSSFSDVESANDALNQKTYDLIILSADDVKQSSNLIQQLHRPESSYSILIASNQVDAVNAAKLLSVGARGILDLDNRDITLYTLQRELKDLLTRRKYQKLKLAYDELDQRFCEMVESSRDAIACVQDGMLLFTNSNFAQRVGYEQGKDLRGLPFLDLIADADRSRMQEVLQAYSRGESPPANMEVQIKGARGVAVPIEMDIKSNRSGEKTSLLLTLHRPNSNQELENKLRMLKSQDLLTGLFNRQYFLERLKSTITNPGDKTYALFYVEVDDFKELKNRLGIAGSDMVLVEIAELLRKLLQVTHYTSRYDGSVFTALLAVDDKKDSVQTARRICHAVKNHAVRIESQSITTSCSIGICMLDGLTAKDALNHAHKAADQAHAGGGNQVKFHIPMDDELADQDLQRQWQQKIEQALAQGRFQLVYQPIVSLHGQSGEKYEALLRMQSQDGDPIAPAQFIPAAEKTGQMASLDRWVIEHAITNLAQKGSSEQNITLFIKLSSASIEDISLTPWLSRILKHHQIKGQQLVFEVVEEFCLTNMKSMKALSTGLKKLGSALALDHFGRTPKSAAIQKHLQANYLKIDGTIIGQLGMNGDAVDRIKTLNAIATATDSQTIAQFVEDANCLAQLWQTGVNYIQGYFVQEPDALMSYDFND
ncbi:MAG: GGDEF domain-containing protein [Gammaproteobacteria bacterium]|nr:GGDEF domain-containing protein [Gammaproteobacteria bacterium]